MKRGKFIMLAFRGVATFLQYETNFFILFMIVAIVMIMFMSKYKDECYEIVDVKLDDDDD
jgi:hypothetical protein